MNKTALPFIACLLAFSVAGAHAQSVWKWRDAAGQLHISDTAPPAGTPARNIISSPMGGVVAPPSTATGASASPPVDASATALDKKKKAAEQEKADKDNAARAAAQAQNAAVRKDNCARAQAALPALESGQRLARIDAKGEREYLDDSARNTEIKHAQDVIASNCGAAPAQ